MDTQIQVPCPLCGCVDTQTHSDVNAGSLEHQSLGSSRKTVSHGRLLRCPSCSFVFSEFRPADEDLHKLYREMDTTVYERESQGRRRTAMRHLRILEQYARAGHLLDVGCASGNLLAAAADTGWAVTGVEPASSLCERAAKLLNGRGQVQCLPLQQAKLTPSSFDVVTMWDVLEHVTDPVKFLGLCVTFLKPSGILIVNVPDISSFQAWVLGEHWPLLLPEHLNYFDRKSLKYCGEIAGLRWVAFGSRPASFSLDYILFRLSQHGIPGAGFGRRAAAKAALGQLSLPIFLGESYCVWQRP
jgi:SAM-dependent methyltransferase